MKLNIENIEALVSKEEIKAMEEKMLSFQTNLMEKKGEGNEFMGWVNLPNKLSKHLILDIEAEASKIRSKADVYIVIGIGGSYLGTRAVVESLQHSFNSLKRERTSPYIIYAGHTLSEDYMADLIEILDKKDYALCVISKSGTTLEPALSFRVLRSHIENKYGKEEARQRIIAITDKEKGALKTLATKEGYKTYVVPDDVGGRFSVLTPVGLLPISVAGYDIRELIHGAKKLRHNLTNAISFDTNPAWQYAIVRNILYGKGKKIEIMSNYNPSLTYFSEWWKQLMGESEGKNGKGIFPVSITNTTDLHSLGQYIQEGERTLFETVISVEKSRKRVRLPLDKEDSDGLNYLSNLSLTEINLRAEEGVRSAHLEGGVPQIRISIERLDEENLGGLICFFEFACALSAYLLGENPFNQPGVEAYKRNMFALLGKK